uniref:Uncharacterized protein n=1 Tax=Heliothis virescens TaxID=7102 RepID=A0A2A4JZ10_HELVI
MADKLVKKRSSMKAKLTTFGAHLNVLKSYGNRSFFGQADEAYAARDQFEQQYYPLVALARSLLPGLDGECQRRDSADSEAKLEATMSAVVMAVNNNGERCNARILLDNGSTANFITRTCVTSCVCPEMIRSPR